MSSLERGLTERDFRAAHRAGERRPAPRRPASSVPCGPTLTAADKVSGVPASSPRRWTRRLTAVAAAAALPLLSACATFSPATTTYPYNASDGISVDLGDLHAANLLVVGAEKGGTAVLSGALFNKGSESLQVAVSTQSAPTPVTIEVPGRSMVQLAAGGTGSAAAATSSAGASATGATGGTTATVLVPSLPVAPGAVMTVQIATRAGGQTQVKVPVLLPQNEYATITAPPSATSTPTQSPTGQPVPTGNESAEPTTSPS